MNKRFVNLVSCIVVSDEKLLLVRNKWLDRSEEGWTLPCGHLNVNERLTSAAERELFEETGLLCNDEPQFQFTLQVFKQNETILNFVFLIPSYRGALTALNDPDGIVSGVEFMPFAQAISMIIYEDVRTSLRQWKSNINKPLIYCDLRQVKDASQ